ncbi:MAG TPA: hypothetical protein VMT76_07105 [Puia sp.]|nr:hypothetical protein [Puia sp.]
MRFALLTDFITFTALVQYHAHEDGGIINKITNFPYKLFSKIDKEIKELEEQPDNQTEKYPFVYNSILKEMV